jgi:hypothetical protein
MGNSSVQPTAPFCARNVATLETAESAINGIFSSTRFHT